MRLKETWPQLPYIKTLLSLLEETKFHVEIHYSLKGEMNYIIVVKDDGNLVAEAWRLPHGLWRLRVDRKTIGDGPCLSPKQ